MNFAERYGPWAVIAGASEGTGSAFARQVAAQGINCIVIGRRADRLAELAEALRDKYGVECVTITADLATEGATERIIEAVGYREVGLFINNAGSDPNGAHFLDRDMATWRALVQRNVMTMMRCCHHFAVPMRLRGHGGLLLVNSGACYGGARFMAAYAASKAFTLCFAESLWDELRGDGVDVLTLVLGVTDTPALRTLLDTKGLPMPEGVADPAAVAALGLDRLPHGPIQNWGLDDDTAGYAGISAGDRRRRVIAVGESSSRVFGQH